MEIFDHCAIFVLIAATYTPFTLVACAAPWAGAFGACVVWRRPVPSSSSLHRTLSPACALSVVMGFE